VAKVKVKLSDVAEAFELGSGDVSYSLDLATGAVTAQFDDFDDDFDDDLDEDDDPKGAAPTPGRDLIQLPSEAPFIRRGVLESFALQQSEPLRGELMRAITGKAAFRRFDDLLGRWPGGAR